MFSKEFIKNEPLQWAFAALLFAYFICFNGWAVRSTITMQAFAANHFVCPAYFQQCDIFYFLQALPQGYSQTFLYMLLFATIVWAGYLVIQKNYREAQFVTIPVYLWHILNVFVLTDFQSGNYEYYLAVFGTILLFLPYKLFFLKLSIVLLYVMSTVAKIHPAWIEGGYFTNMQMGLPIFPAWSIPIWTNLVILAEMVGAWFLFSKNPLLQRGAFLFFVIFHLYSGILVHYRYPATVLPMLLIVFGPWYQYQKIPLNKKAITSWVFMAILLTVQFTPRFIEGDEKLTLEGNKYGLYMFEANHQCISTAVVHYTEGQSRTLVKVEESARNRCEPYQYWFQYKQMCERNNQIKRIEWTHDHSINGDPFLRIVDEKDVCSLEYEAFSHNEWIKTHKDSPKVTGLPAMNYYK